MMIDIKVSIIVPVYNSEIYLEKCLESLINQTLEEIEIICVNDGSFDNSLVILEEYAKKDNRIIVINQENMGQSKARNVAFDRVRGEYIGFVDSDDWVDLDFYRNMYDAAIKNNADIAVSSMIRKRKYHQKWRVHYQEEKIYTDIYDKLRVTKYPQQCYMPNKIVKKSKLIDEFNIRYVEGMFYEDIEFVMRVLYYLEKMVTVPKVNYFYRVNQSSTVKQKQSQKLIEDKAKSLGMFVDFAKEKGLNLPEKTLCIAKNTVKFLGIPIIKTVYWQDYSKKYLFSHIYLGKYAKIQKN